MSTISSLISSGGGGSEINDNKVINSLANSITTESGEVWLKSGVISGAVSTYPDAQTLITGGTYTNTNWYVGFQAAIPSGITWDGSFFYVCDRTYNGLVYKYNSLGVYQNTSFISNGGENNGLTWDGTYFYMGNTDGGQVYRYNSSWTLQNWAITSVGGVTGVAVIGSVIYILRDNGYIYAYNISASGGTNTHSINTAAELGGAEQTLATDGQYLYAVSTAGVAYKYDPLSGGAGYLGVSFSVNALSSTAIQFGGLVFKDTDLYSINATDDKAFKYNQAFSVGLTSEVKTDGGTIYTRVK